MVMIIEITKKWSMPIRNWRTIIGQLMIFFEDRFKETA
jgi:transposase-like protein